MVTLICYEWRKHFRKVSLITVLLLFTMINIGKIHSVRESNSLLANPGWKALYLDEFQDFGGIITDRKIKELMTIYQPLVNQTADLTLSTTYRPVGTRLINIYEDWNFFRYCFVNPMKYNYEYKAYAIDVANKAEENKVFFKSIGNYYESKKNSAISRLFLGREIASFSYTEMYKFYVQYDFSALLVLLLSLYGLMSVFLSEKETEMDTLLLTTTMGGARTVWAKVMASALYVCFVSFWFWFVDYMTFSIVFGSWNASGSPLYALEDFIHAGLNVSLGQYALLSGLLKTLGILVVGGGFLFISNLFQNALIPYIANLILAFGCIYQQEAFMSSGHILLRIINPFVLVVNRDLFRKAEFVSLLGYPLPGYIAAILFGLVWGIGFLCALGLCIRKNALRKGGKRVDMVI
ncbi:hypothetical protein [Paenibacillus etheri]|uniref:Uncharacterized protein n=1 Tax=Paenibacillus etheri TaxID=1306852 RepID=A0A0W1B458_9BACL|nr:hypothetical protein [Paenibacillus etheri]KTD88334.1 hypothetical protein UQ64_05980 [Paenibacillus etheri]